MNNDLYLKTLTRKLLEKGLSKDRVVEVLKQKIKTIKEQQQTQFKDFIFPLQKAIEPKWSYEEKFFQKVINDYSYYLHKRPCDLFLLEASPRTGKTELITGFGVPYILAFKKNIKIVVVCGNQALKRKLRKTISRVVKSDYYKQKYNVYFTIDNANEIHTNNNNLILFTTTLSEVPTGEGFHYIFLEDALTHSMIESPAKTENAFEQLDGLLTRTQDDPFTQLIVNNQRLGINDLSARLISRYNEIEQDYIRITMPFQFKNDEVIKDLYSNEYHFKENEFLTKRFDEYVKNKIIAKIGSHNFETQYQQNPTDDENAYVKKEYLQQRYTLPQEYLQQDYFDNIIISADMASKTKKTSDYTAFVCVGVKNGLYYVLDVLRQKSTAPVLYNEVCDFYCKWNLRRQPILLIEDKSSGEAVIEMIKQQGIFDRQKGIKLPNKAVPIMPRGSKEDRVLNCLYLFQTNCVLLPKNAKWLVEFENELCQFPNSKNDDQVDALSQVLNFALSSPRQTKIY